jgi:hypothetical protein
MPIETPAQGTLEVENAKFRASSLEATIAVGIGTDSNDAYPLQVFKETAPDIRIREGSTISSAARLYSNNSNLYIQTGADFTAGSSGDVAFQTMEGQSTHMVIKNDGKVGIGTTSPGYKLDVRGGVVIAGKDAVSTQGLHFAWNRSGASGASSIMNQRGLGAGGIEFGEVTTGDVFTPHMVIKNDGKVGVGTVSPDGKLDIYTGSASTVALSFDRYSSGNYRTDIYQNQYGPDFRVGYNTYTPESVLYLKRFSNGNKEVEINGNVGIGTDDPNYTLDVNGNMRCNSFTLSQKAGDQGEFIVERKDNGYTQSALPLAHIDAFTISINIPDVDYTTTSSKLTFTIDDDNTGSRWMLKMLVRDAEGGIKVRVNSGTIHLLHYDDTPQDPREDNDDSWTTIDITDDVVYAGATNTIYWWSASTDGSSVRAAYVFPTSGPALPNEPVETDLHLYNGLYVSPGNVGIGLTNPSTRLEVNGDIGIGRVAGGYTFREVPGGNIRAGIHSDANNNLLLNVANNVNVVKIDVTGTNGSRLRMNRASDGSQQYNISSGSSINGSVGESAEFGFHNGSGGGQIGFFGNYDSVGNKRHGYFNGGKLYLENAIYQNNSGVNFTGQHRTWVKDASSVDVAKLYEGMIVSSCHDEYIRMDGGVAVGIDAITINECLPLVSLSNVAYDKRCFGVLSSSEDPEKRESTYGNLIQKLIKEEGDTRVFINSLGEGAIWVVNTAGSLESGDYITTSNVSGYGQRQSDDILHNYTVGKITMNCDFNPSMRPKKQIKKELKDVTYYYSWNSIDEEIYNVMVENGETNKKIETDENGVNIYYRRDETKEYREDWDIEVRQELVNVLDEHGQLQWEDDPSGATEPAYKIRYLDASGQQTDEANAVHIAAFVGCTYHCG